nr:Outer capsid protein [Tibet orbivirus]
MDEFAIAVVTNEQTKREEGLVKYPIIVDKIRWREAADQWVVKDTAGRRGIWSMNQLFTVVLKTPAPDDSTIVAPDFLDLMLKQYQMNHGRGLEKEKEWAERQSMYANNFQVCFFDRSRYAGKAVTASLIGEIHADATLVEAAWIDYHLLKKFECRHDNMETWCNLGSCGLDVIGQPQAYVVKESMELMDVDKNKGWDGVVKRGVQEKLKVKPRTRIDEKILKHKNDLDTIANSWAKIRKDVPIGKICFHMSSIAKLCGGDRETLSENIETSKRFRGELTKLLNLQTDEAKKIEAQCKGVDQYIVLFSTLCVIAACDVVRGRVDWECKHACLRGAVIYAEYTMGDVYKYLRDKMAWSVRWHYVPNAITSRMEKRQHVFRRCNLFERGLGEGTQCTIWHVDLDPEYVASKKTGFICVNNYEEDVEDEIRHWFDDKKYMDLITNIISHHKEFKDVKNEELFLDKNNIDIMDFEKDAYLDEHGILKVPEYYDRMIRSPIYSATFKISADIVEVAESSDLWQKRTSKGFLAFGEDVWGIPTNKLSMHTTLLGNALQENIPQSALFSEVEKRMRSKYRCDYKCLLDNMNHHASICMTKRINQVVRTYAQGAAWDGLPGEYDEGVEVIQAYETIEQCVVSEIRKYFEELGTYDVDCRVVCELLVDPKRRLVALQENFPRLHMKLTTEMKTVEDTLAINLFLLLILSHTHVVTSRIHIPVILYCSTPKLMVVRPDHMSIRTLLKIMRYHPGEDRRRHTLNELDLQWINILRKYLVTSEMVHLVQDMSGTQIRSMQFILYQSTYCNSVSEIVCFPKAVIHPRRGIIIFAITDGFIEKDAVRSRIMRHFRRCPDDVIGIAVVVIGPERQTMSYGFGVCSSKMYHRRFLGMLHDVSIVKTKGHVFGNEELITKLVNI